ncbi:MAG: hypothetical protein MRY74_05810 [Neomegalonema sp.]|nr:hypothetical protein [Neomegalonema sp.]
MSLIPATELDAVNLMLATIGESPVATLEQSGQVDAVTAQRTLGEISAEVQSRGWHFNTDKAYPLYAQAHAPYEIAIPANAARIDPAGASAHLDLAVRGGKLWDRRRHSFSFAGAPKVLVDIVWVLPFAEMPQPARRFAAIRAARVFQDRVVGAGQLHGFTEKDERRAEAGLRKYEAKTAQRSFLNASHAVMRVLNRRAR